MIGDPPTFDVEAEARQQAAEAYRNRDDFVADAIDWASQWGHEHAGLVDVIVAYYDGTRPFWDAVEDIMDGER